MKAILAAALLLAATIPAHAVETQCGRVRWSAHNGIMTYQGKFALVRINPVNR